MQGLPIQNFDISKLVYFGQTFYVQCYIQQQTFLGSNSISDLFLWSLNVTLANQKLFQL